MKTIKKIKKLDKFLKTYRNFPNLYRNLYREAGEAREIAGVLEYSGGRRVNGDEITKEEEKRLDDIVKCIDEKNKKAKKPKSKFYGKFKRFLAKIGKMGGGSRRKNLQK